MTVKTWTAAALVLAGTVLATRPAAAQTYPSRVIKFVVPFAAGSATDVAGPHRRRACSQDARAADHHREHRWRQWRVGRPERGPRRS